MVVTDVVVMELSKSRLQVVKKAITITPYIVLIIQNFRASVVHLNLLNTQ